MRARAMRAALGTAIALLLAACAGTNPGGSSSGSSQIEVFGTIDAGVSGVTNKSGR